MGFWGTFYAVAVSATLLHSVSSIRRGKTRHAAGGVIILLSWVASYFARDVLHDPTPLIAYAGIDTVTAFAFLLVAIRYEAAWAGICVIIHAVMCALHLSFFVTGEGNTLGYLWILNSLFLTALIVINTAILAGRFSWGAYVDDLFASRLGGWTFSGVRR